MEQRWSNRTIISVSIAIHYAPLGLIIGRTRDVSSQGMFVETKYIALPPNEVIQVSFVSPLLQHGINTTAEAEVMHTSNEGVGLYFQNMEFCLSTGPAKRSYRSNSDSLGLANRASSTI